MDVVVEKSAGMTIVQFIQVHLAGMGEGCMADVMTQCDSLDEIQIQIQRSANGPGDPGHQLHMQTPTGNVIVFHQGKNLRLIRIAIIIRTVQDSVNVLGKIRTPDRRGILIGFTADDHVVRKCQICVGSGILLMLNDSGKFLGKSFFRHGITSYLIFSGQYPVFYYTTNSALNQSIF